MPTVDLDVMRATFGDLVTQVVILQSQLNAAQARIAELETKTPKTDAA